jgi:hypothetical protein
MKPTVFKKLSTRPMKKASLARMRVGAASTSMSTSTQEQEPIFAERNQPSLKAWRESQVDPDSSLPFPLMPECMGVLPLSPMLKQWLCVPP